MARHLLVFEANKIYKKLANIVGNKFPTSVQVVGSPNLGQKKTMVLSIKTEGDVVTVTFKDVLWGSKKHIASSIRDGVVRFDIPSIPGRGEDPYFTIKN